MSSADESQPLLGNNRESAGHYVDSHSSNPREEFSKERSVESTDGEKNVASLSKLLLLSISSVNIR